MAITTALTHCPGCQIALCLRCRQCHALDCQTAVLSCMAEDASVPPLLIEHLSVSVLLAMWQIGEHGPTAEQIERACLLVESHALDETILYPVPGETRTNVARLTEMLAILAYQPGGVQFGELHFEARVQAR